MARDRGQIQQRGYAPNGTDRKWLVRIYLGQDTEGKRRYSSKTVTGSYRQAEQALTKLQAATDTQTFIEPSKTSVGVWLKQWLAGRQAISSASKVNYESILKNYLIPQLGTVQLDQLTQAHVSKLVTDLQAKGLSSSTIRYSVRVLKSSIQNAVQLRFLLRNACEFVELPAKSKKKATALSFEDTKHILEVAKDHHLYALFHLLFTTAMRPQEARALLWKDIDLDKGTVSITKAMTYATKTASVVGDTKTEGSQRVLSIPQATVDVLKAHRKGEARISPLVFPTATGGYYSHAYIWGQWKQLLVDAGVPHCKLYTTRHTHLTQMLASGENVKVVQERAGHANVQTLLDHYAHVMPGMDKAASDKVAKRLFG